MTALPSKVTEPVKHDVLIENDVEATMRDGVVLRSTVYRPNGSGRFPVLLTRTPYGRDLSVNSGYLNPTTVAAAGFVVIMQDVRGRFGSDGDFVPSENEGADGYDTVQWAAELPYSTGAVGMWGRSYFAETQWRAAQEKPPALRGIAPGISAGGNARSGGLVRGGAVEFGARLGWGHYSAGPAEIAKLSRTDPVRAEREWESWARIDRAMSEDTFLDILPVRDMAADAPAFFASPIVESLGFPIDHPTRDLWDSASDRAVDLPSLHIGGWYDIFVNSTLDQYFGQLAHSDSGAAPTPYLIVGPWSHTNFSGLGGSVVFGSPANQAVLDSGQDLSSVHAQWYASVLGDEEPDMPRVRIFVMGENRWRTYDRFPEPARTAELFLAPGGTLVAEAEGADGSVDYDYDPADPVPTVGGATMMPGTFAPGALEQSRVESRDDVLVFTGEALTEPLTVIGRVSATLFASSSAVDTDFVVRLCRVTADGTSITLTDGMVRSRYRDSYRTPGTYTSAEPSLLVPGEVYEYAIDLWSTAVTFQPGERIRVHVTSSNHPRWDRNLNTGESAYESSEFVVAHQAVHTGERYPSRVSLSVVR
ncbi:CocE/NonD family hydrolase [Rhodococcus sp. IEGM 248]|uniref:CocE/NonD family hydrolase n=1 Tax=Rhodococcus opacus TaxID=37919 RepID=UPI0013C12975|nr:CocE/NonD family hydrolase [Rhodococcus opacus]MDV7087087.1 CocE/NonD family hydrolase [Rhodococcus opacus]NDV08407.1 CocE/NonD family hydrolase [Rhodococcus sp. IEGM 248]